jgi:hypothetical protein
VMPWQMTLVLASIRMDTGLEALSFAGAAWGAPGGVELAQEAGGGNPNRLHLRQELRAGRVAHR